jgi:CRISPR system Cascade subunit CasE
MYLSKLVLNWENAKAQHDLSDAHALHQRIMQAFPDEQREKPRNDWNILFRQEPDSEVILIQSDLEPTWNYLSDGYLRDQPISKAVNLDIEKFSLGQQFQFRLRANPSKRDHKTKKTIGFYKQVDQLSWLERQAERNGFNLHGVDVIPAPNLFGKKGLGKSPIRITTVLYQGILKVTEPTQFLQAIQQGIGRGRSYGCGLLSVAKFQS